MILMPACLEPALLVALDEGDGLAARRQEDEHRFGLGVLDRAGGTGAKSGFASGVRTLSTIFAAGAP